MVFVIRIMGRLSLIGLMLVVDGGIRKLQSQNIISIKSISLKGVNDDRCLLSRFKISETENDFLTWLLLPRNKANSFESLEWSKDMGDFPLTCIQRYTFNIDCVGGILWNRHDLRRIKDLFHMSSEIFETRNVIGSLTTCSFLMVMIS